VQLDNSQMKETPREIFSRGVFSSYPLLHQVRDKMSKYERFMTRNDIAGTVQKGYNGDKNRL
jgi:hypothetical protein